MIVTWIAIQSQPLPWSEGRKDLAYVACGEQRGELSLVCPEGVARTPAIDRMLKSIESAIEQRREAAKPDLGWLRKAIPDQGTSIRLSSLHRCQAESYEALVRRLALPH